jgi:hypothetical protein
MFANSKQHTCLLRLLCLRRECLEKQNFPSRHKSLSQVLVGEVQWARHYLEELAFPGERGYRLPMRKRC